MTTEEIKSEIMRIVDELPEERLIELLNFLKGLKEYPGLDIPTFFKVKRVIDEDSEVFRRLAE
jgi:hypothetical protein